MDSLRYFYKSGTNQLDYIRDKNSGSTAHSSNYGATVDIKDQASGNYVYNAIGELNYDRISAIDSIKWNVYGKMQHIYKHEATYGTAASGLHYYYDPSGNRSGMAVLYNPSTYNVYTWYVRDAQGNVMAVYKANGSNLATIALKLKEHYMYGSSRLGVINRDMDVDQPRLTADNSNANLGTAYLATFTRGDKLFEFTNHLGNVLFTATDAKVPKAQTGNPSLVGSYSVSMVTAVDYTPFGMIMQGMNYGSAAPGKYRYGFNGKEWENSTKGNADQIDYGERMYDNRAGRFLSVDPLTAQYPWYSPYQFAGNTPIQAIDLDGQEEYHYIMSLDKQGKTVLKLNSTKYYNEHNWFGYKFKTKIDHERYIVDFAGSKYYIGFASNVGRNNNWKRAEFKQFLKNPDALAFIYTFDDAQTEARNAFISDMQIAGVAALGVYDNMRLGLIRQRTAINPQGLKRLNEYNFKRAYKPTTFEGEEIPASKNGLSPDFKNTSFLYKAEGNQSSIVKIKLTGKYFGEGGDFEAANLAGGFKNTPKGYTWHHLDDFDPATGTSTMQLVRKDAHGETITHTGSVRQYELYNNAEYKVK